LNVIGGWLPSLTLAFDQTMKRRRLLLIVSILGVSIFSFIALIGSRERLRNDLVISFAGWTNVVRTNVPGRTYAAYGPCVLLAITNINPTRQIEFFSAESIEAFEDGQWIEIAHTAQSTTWLIGGAEWPSGHGHHVPLRILAELPRECPWRVRMKYNLTPSKAIKTVNEWLGRLTPFDNALAPEDHYATSSTLPPSASKDSMDAIPTASPSELNE
jgi:hypothetical protein